MSPLRRVCSLFALLATLPLAAEELPEWGRKVDPWVLDRLASRSEAEFLVLLGTQADLSGADRLATKAAKGRYVYERLKATAERSQPALLERLRRDGHEHRPFWVANMVWVRGDAALVEELASRDDVAHIYANPRVELDLPRRDVLAKGSGRAIEPSLAHVGAPKVFWARGFTGQGVVIGGQDTGYSWSHPALRSKYRGAAGGVDHNYNWHDAIHASIGPCGADSREPCDDNNHGTHTMGTMVGDDGEGNRIGMAPGATWIGCRNMDGGVGTPASYSECFQWFIAPTDLADRNPDPDAAPDVINNSWSCPPSEGCTDPNVLRRVVENTRKAGILVVVSAGNEGPDCETVASPAAIYDASLTVGASNNFDGITGFSSRGPVSVDGSGRLKPDVVAPGFQIRSSVLADGYDRFNGTSMAGPHVAGLAALVISAAGCLRGNVDAIERHILETAQPVLADQSCGGSGDDVPNAVYGHGAIRAALPACGDGISGAATGMALRKLVCRNRSSRPRQKVTARLGGADAWDCGAQGLSAGGGDRVKVQLTATASGGGEVGGSIEGIPKAKVVCKNQSAGGKTTIRPGDGEPWDCRGAGLAVSDGDALKVTISGKAG